MFVLKKFVATTFFKLVDSHRLKQFSEGLNMHLHSHRKLFNTDYTIIRSETSLKANQYQEQLAFHMIQALPLLHPLFFANNEHCLTANTNCGDTAKNWNHVRRAGRRNPLKGSHLLQ